MAFDLIIRNGTVHDGSGAPPVVTDVGVSGDVVTRVGAIDDDVAAGTVLDATGLVIAPGFIDILSHGYLSIVADPRSLSTLTQGVTTLIFGEGWSMGPTNDDMRAYLRAMTGRELELPWTRLSEYLDDVEKSGVSQNIASLIGSFNPRMWVMGTANRPATAAELDRMRGLVAEEMADGALGIGSALIYPPGSFAATEELIALCQAAAPYGGRYFSHMRSEGDHLLDAVDELLRISREAEVPAEIWHLKAAGRDNWPKMERVIEKVEAARDRGEPITADVYPYTAGSTMLFAAVPPWFRDGAPAEQRARLDDPATRAAMRAAIADTTDGWENLWRATGGDGSGVTLLHVHDESLAPYVGRSVAEVAAAEGSDDPIETLLSLVQRDPAIMAAYFIASEDNLRRQIALPWVAFGSDADSIAAEGEALQSAAHPRTYGTFPRVLGRYVRDEGVASLPDVVRRMTSFPAETLGLDRRGRVAEGWFADLVVFDAETVADRATYADAHQYSVGVRDVVVNGSLVLRDGRHTGAFNGRALRGPGRRGA